MQIIPAQFTGDKSKSTYSITTPSVTAAQTIYEQAKERLLQVNEWQKICGPHSASFQLTDEKGTPLFQKAAVGNYMRIDLPGPGNKSGGGYDWVVIEEIAANDSPTGKSNYVAMRVRPVKMAHFYKNTATSSFIVERIGKRVTASVYGRNEIPDTKTGNWLDKIRNIFIFLTTVLGFQKPQWKSLVTGLLK